MMCEQSQKTNGEQLILLPVDSLVKTYPLWDYPNEALLTLCEDCHEIETENMPSALEQLEQGLKLKCCSDDIRELAEAITKLKPYEYGVTGSIFSYIFRQDNFDKSFEDMMSQFRSNNNDFSKIVK